MDWLALPSVGRSGGIIVIWDDQIVELVDSKVGTYAVCIKFKPLLDDFVWGLIGVYGPNDDNLRHVFFDDLKIFLSLWDIPWCLEVISMWLDHHLKSHQGADFLRQCWNFTIS